MTNTKTATAFVIPDEEIERVHGYANFGNMSKRQVVDEGVVTYALGFTSGHTQFSILREHGLIKKYGGSTYESELTKKGRAYLRALFSFDELMRLLREVHNVAA